MNVYLRLLQFSKPLGKRVIPYVVFTFLSVIFGLLNFTLLIPLLDVLFKNLEIDKLLVKPEFQFSADYMIAIFNYYFASVIKDYGRLAALQYVVIGVVISVTFSNIFKYLSQVQIEGLRFQTVTNFRNAIFDKMTRLHLAYFSNERKGDLISRIMTDVNEVDSSITSTLAVFFKEPLTLIVLFFALFKISPGLTLFTLITIPVSGTVISFFTKKIRKDSNQVLISGGRLHGILDETLFGIRVTKAFNAEKYIREKFRSESYHYSGLQRKIALRKELSSPFSEFSGVLVVSFILLYGGSLVIANDSALSASAFVGYIILFSQVLRPAKSISTSLTGMQKGLAAWERIKEVLDTPEAISDNENAVVVNEFSQQIEFKNVSFSYGDRPILKGIDFTLKKGKMVALVGPSGGGKSTMADLLPRFYDPQSGNILIDGINLKNVTIQSLRDQIGMVSQESFLFHDTIYNNIVFGKSDVTQEQVEHAAKIANAHEFILRSEHGYQTVIGDRGIKLSGGQKQRINIARAILRNPSILILDEATSALDTESEKLVQQALDNLMQNRTTLVIAHRLSTIQHADEILVIKDGQLVESGTHSQLLEIQQGIYSKLSILQS